MSTVDHGAERVSLWDTVHSSIDVLRIEYSADIDDVPAPGGSLSTLTGCSNQLQRQFATPVPYNVYQYLSVVSAHSLYANSPSLAPNTRIWRAIILRGSFISRCQSAQPRGFLTSVDQSLSPHSAPPAQFEPRRTVCAVLDVLLDDGEGTMSRVFHIAGRAGHVCRGYML